MPERTLGEGLRAGRSCWRSGSRQAEVSEDPLDDRPLVNEGDDLAAAAAVTGEDVLAEDAKEQLGPRYARVGRTRRLAFGQRCGCWLARSWGCYWAGGRRRRRRHDLRALLRGGPEDAVVAHEVRARRWNQRGETAQQLARLQDEDLAAGAEAALHAIGELAVGKRGEALLREGRPGPMAAQVSQALPVVRVQMDTGVQRKALAVRGERAPLQELLRSKGALPIGPLTVVEGGEGAPARRAGLPPQRFASADPVSSCPRHGLWQIPNPGLTLVRNIS